MLPSAPASSAEQGGPGLGRARVRLVIEARATDTLDAPHATKVPHRPVAVPLVVWEATQNLGVAQQLLTSRMIVHRSPSVDARQPN
jgi:hypothetical protein